jgi:hypothetical protein
MITERSEFSTGGTKLVGSGFYSNKTKPEVGWAFSECITKEL